MPPDGASPPLDPPPRGFFFLTGLTASYHQLYAFFSTRGPGPHPLAGDASAALFVLESLPVSSNPGPDASEARRLQAGRRAWLASLARGMHPDKLWDHPGATLVHEYMAMRIRELAERALDVLCGRPLSSGAALDLPRPVATGWGDFGPSPGHATPAVAPSVIEHLACRYGSEACARLRAAGRGQPLIPRGTRDRALLEAERLLPEADSLSSPTPVHPPATPSARRAARAGGPSSPPSQRTRSAAGAGTRPAPPPPPGRPPSSGRPGPRSARCPPQQLSLIHI